MGSDLDRIVPLRPDGTRPPLYCIHAVSGSAYSYAGLARLLGDDQPVYGFEAPGFDNDRIPLRSIAALADEYTQTLTEFDARGGYRLLGWSLGGLVGFEMAKRLVAAGSAVSTLIFVDAGLPSVMDLPPEREVLHRYVRDMMGRSDESPPELAAIFGGWPEDVAPEAVFAAVESAGVLPEEIDADVLANQYSVFRAHLEAFYSVEVAGTYRGPAVHILAAESPIGDMRWSQFAPDIEEHIVPGTHHSIWSGDSLSAMSEIVRHYLTQR